MLYLAGKGMDVTEEIGQEYPPDTWRIIDGEITRTTTYSTSSYTTTLCWCQGCEEPWMMYDDGSGTHGDCLGPSVPLGSLLPMQSGRKGDDVAESEDFDPCGSFDCSLPKGHNMGRADIPANHHSEDFERSGIWYCRRHSGIVSEDEHRGLCPWWDHADHCDAEHDEGLDDGACSPCQWVELVIPPAALSDSKEGVRG